MWTVTPNPRSSHTGAIIALRTDGSVPVLIKRGGLYPEQEILSDNGVRLADAAYVSVTVGAESTFRGVEEIEKRVARVWVARMEPTAATDRLRSAVTHHVREFAVELPAFDATMLFEEQVIAAVAAAEPQIAAALAETRESVYEIVEARWAAQDAENDAVRAILAPTPAPDTQGAAVEAMGFDPVKHEGRVIEGALFKPDASRARAGSRCDVCGTAEDVAWIAGAGRALCVEHQDEY